MYQANLAHNSTLICAILYTSKSDHKSVAALFIWASRATGGERAPFDSFETLRAVARMAGEELHTSASPVILRGGE